MSRVVPSCDIRQQYTKIVCKVPEKYVSYPVPPRERFDLVLAFLLYPTQYQMMFSEWYKWCFVNGTDGVLEGYPGYFLHLPSFCYFQQVYFSTNIFSSKDLGEAILISILSHQRCYPALK